MSTSSTLVRYDTSPIGTGKNWVTKTDPEAGLGPFIRAVAHALMRNGHSEQDAIQLAVGVMKRWAAGGSTWGKKSHPTPQTVAKAQAALAHWEALKAKDHTRMDTRSGQVVVVPKGKKAPTQQQQQQAANRKAAASKTAGKTASKTAKATQQKNQQARQQAAANAKGDHAAGHPFYGNQHSAGNNQPGAQQQPQPAQAAQPGVPGQPAVPVAPIVPVQSPTSAATSAISEQNNLVQAVGEAQDRYNKAKSSAQSAARTLASAQLESSQYTAQANQNLEFAKERLVNTPAGVKNEDAYQAMELSTQQKAASLALSLSQAQEASDEAEEQLKQSQAQLEKAMTTAGFRSMAAAELHVRVHRARTGYRFVGEGNPAGVGDSSGASTLLPVGPSKKQSKAITDSMEAVAAHRFHGSNLMSCDVCGQSVNAPIHRSTSSDGNAAQPIAPAPRMARSEADVIARLEELSIRHGGPHHEPTTTGHINRIPARHKQAAHARNLRNFRTVEEPMTTSLQHLFADQRSSTLNRLNGKRGKALLARAAAAMATRDAADGDPNDQADAQDNATSIPVDSSQIFDPAYWTAKTADVIAPHLAHARSLAVGEVTKQLDVPDSPGEAPSGPTGGSGGDSGTDGPGGAQIWPGGNAAPLMGIVADRAQNAAQYVTTTTANQLQDALQEGVGAGEGRDAIAERVNDVFDDADMNRAKLIAQTETVGAYNEAQTAYAAGLPSGTVGHKVWLAHHDTRTRPTHRVADAQEKPMGSPYIVGDSTMEYPGDKAAPIGEWINCRCSQAFLPPGMTYAPMVMAAQQYMDSLHAKPPKVESPYDTSEVHSGVAGAKA